MTATVKQFEALEESNAGYCVSCDEVTQDGGVEPDAEGYKCPKCETNNLMGVEQAMLLEHIEIVVGE